MNTTAVKPNKSSLRTKRKLADAFEDLLANRSFDSVSVTNIVEACDFSRQTFYRYFTDKYDLVLYIYNSMVQDTMFRIGEDLTWTEAVVAKLEIMREKQAFYAEAYKSHDYNSLLERDADIVHAYYIDNIKRLAKRDVSYKESFLLRFYAVGSTRSTARWARTGMKEEPRLLAEFYAEMLPNFAKPIFFGEADFPAEEH